MVRRAHRKSRNGCLECKRRHVKCDERRPICTQCSITERACEYRAPATPSEVTPSPSPPAPAPSTRTATGATTIPNLDNAVSSQTDPPANLLHLQLLYHFTTQTSQSLTTGLDSLIFTPQLMDLSLATPYLANELLALSALHLSTTASDPHTRKAYHHHAAQLQTHALAAFNQGPDLVHITEDTCAPLLLFSSCLGLHTLCDTLVFRDDPHTTTTTTTDFRLFLTRFVHYLRLHHGVRAVTRSAWPLLRASPLSPILEGSAALFDSRHNKDNDDNLAPPCRHLWDRVTARRLGADSTRVYHQAIRALQLAANASRISLEDDVLLLPTSTTVPANSRSTSNGNNNESQSKINTNGVIAWPILVSPEYIDLLMHGRPEALVILACYGALLHRFSGLWIFGDGGRFLIEAVGEFLGGGGGEWEAWLVWPRGVLARW